MCSGLPCQLRYTGSTHSSPAALTVMTVPALVMEAPWLPVMVPRVATVPLLVGLLPATSTAVDARVPVPCGEGTEQGGRPVVDAKSQPREGVQGTRKGSDQPCAPCNITIVGQAGRAAHLCGACGDGGACGAVDGRAACRGRALAALSRGAHRSSDCWGGRDRASPADGVASQQAPSAVMGQGEGSSWGRWG